MTGSLHHGLDLDKLIATVKTDWPFGEIEHTELARPNKTTKVKRRMVGVLKSPYNGETTKVRLVDPDKKR